MTLNTAVNNQQLVPRRPSSLPELCAADEAVASALEAVLSANTRLDIHLLPLGQWVVVWYA